MSSVRYLVAANLSLTVGGELRVDQVVNLPETEEVAAVVAQGYLLPEGPDGTFTREVPETQRCCGG